jgi:hypothetical protein
MGSKGIIPIIRKPRREVDVSDQPQVRSKPGSNYGIQ